MEVTPSLFILWVQPWLWVMAGVCFCARLTQFLCSPLWLLLEVYVCFWQGGAWTLGNVSTWAGGCSEGGILLPEAHVDFVALALAQSTVAYAVIWVCRAHRGVGFSSISCRSCMAGLMLVTGRYEILSSAQMRDSQATVTPRPGQGSVFMDTWVH